jgi:hypothetical protein|tara:strand:- start:1512 stop:1985 length:474 start_codon:yes stop_codon:yes gene_type:complete
MFIRKKKINGKEYAYLIKNRYNKRKKQSRQKTTKYLGKVIKLPNFDNPTQASTIRQSIINEFSQRGFKINEDKLTNKDIIIDIKNLTVTSNNKSICLELNEGFLCDHTLVNLVNFNDDNLNQKELMHNLADAFVSAGINLHHDSFIDIFKNKLNPQI